MSIFTEAKKVLDEMSNIEVAKRNLPAFLKRESSYTDVEAVEAAQQRGSTVITVCRSYFYRSQVNGSFIDDALAALEERFPAARVLFSGDHWHEFVGGAATGTAKSSFVYGVIEIPAEEVAR